MLSSLRILPIVLVLFSAAAFASSAAQASKGLTDKVSGIETYATSTEGHFAGVATGRLPGTWSATVVHDELHGDGGAAITGGSFDLLTTQDGSAVTVSGQVVGGTVKQLGGFSGCVNQTYGVVGSLASVGYDGGALDGTGSFNLTLTHYRASVFGYCFIYSASVSGTVTFRF